MSVAKKASHSSARGSPFRHSLYTVLMITVPHGLSIHWSTHCPTSTRSCSSTLDILRGWRWEITFTIHCACSFAPLSISAELALDWQTREVLLSKLEDQNEA